MKIHKIVEILFDKLGYKIQITPHTANIYWQDGLMSIHNHDFMREPAFIKAYRRGISAAGEDYNFHWRVHIALWVAFAASKLGGDFVECGVNRGFLSSAIMERLNWDSLNKMFYLLDTFHGLDERYVSEQEIKKGALEKNRRELENGFYTSTLESVRQNFSQWQNVRIIQGSVPDTLPSVEAEKVAYLHLDMNCSIPEMEALNYFWDRLIPGGFVLLDDYAYYGFESQKKGVDDIVVAKDVQILSLPTGQGLVIKPAR